MYFDATPRRRAPSVITPDSAAPARNIASTNPSSATAGQSPITTACPNHVVVPDWCDTIEWHAISAITFVNPPIQLSEIASRDFCRNEYAWADNMVRSL